MKHRHGCTQPNVVMLCTVMMTADTITPSASEVTHLVESSKAIYKFQ